MTTPKQDTAHAGAKAPSPAEPGTTKGEEKRDDEGGEEEEEEELEADPERLDKLIRGMRAAIDAVGPCTCHEVVRACSYVMSTGAIAMGICRGHLTHQLLDTYDSVERHRKEQLLSSALSEALFFKKRAPSDITNLLKELLRGHSPKDPP